MCVCGAEKQLAIEFKLASEHDYEWRSNQTQKIILVFALFQVLAATQTPGEQGKNWFQGTADAVRQFHWLFEVSGYNDQKTT